MTSVRERDEFDERVAALRARKSEKAEAKARPQRKPKTAADRTVPMALGSLLEEQTNFAQPLVQAECQVAVVGLSNGLIGRVSYAPANHYRFEGQTRTLCGLVIARFSKDSAKGTCQACRAEASRLRAVVRR